MIKYIKLDPMREEFKAQPDRLYGRMRGHPLRSRQKFLFEKLLPTVTFNPDDMSFIEKDIFLEIGAGSGEHAFDQAKKNPDIRYISCEIFENGICSLLSRLFPECTGKEESGEVVSQQKSSCHNLELWPDDARALMKKLPDQSVSRSYLMFPDPWPKKRHAKRRFIHPDNIKEMARIMKIGAQWRVASDHPVYQEWVDDVMKHQDHFSYMKPSLERPSDWSLTRYEQKAYKEGRQPYYWTFIRKE